ncbi:MAG: TonB-dependent receptor [Brevundimonas sp.]|uniref:TonB-dependent receptor n=1 Tax=Brevundimonas sp. TaxID=1871086 RepID=UPI0040345118
MRLTHRLRTTVSAAVVGAVAFGFAGVAAAQDQDTPSTVDDIIVTAQKREQSLQDVPIVVTTLSQQALDNAGVRDIKDLQILTPGLIVTSTTNESVTTARIRGVGTVADNPGIESSVGVVIDGVYRSRNGVGFGDLGEMQRIEVLKGPQGTLFGKNTSAGVINVITEAPSFNFGVNGEATVGNYGAYGLSASVTGPLSDTLALRLYGAKRVRDGFYNVNTGSGPRTLTEDQNQDFGTIRGQLLWLPSDATSVRIIGDFSSRNEDCCVATPVVLGPTAAIIDALTAGNGIAGPPYGAQPFSRDARANASTAQRIKDRGLSMEINHDLNDSVTLTSITAARSWETVNGGDVDFTAADLFYRLPDGNFSFALDQFSQELRFAGSTDRLDWLVGGLYSQEDLARNDSFLFGTAWNGYLSTLGASQIGAPGAASTFLRCITAPFPANVGCATTGFGAPAVAGPLYAPGDGYLDKYRQDSSSFAIFTNNSFRLTEQLELTLGLRYTREEKNLDTMQDNIGNNGLPCAAARLNPVLAPGQPLNALLGGGLCINQTNPDFDGRNYSQTFEDDDISGRFSAQYRFSPSLMVYASAARGFKSGGFNLERSSAPRAANNTSPIPVDDTSFASETVDSYELGFKSTLFDRSLLFNVTAYQQNFQDFQLNTFAGISFIVESIPELDTRGVDMDFLWFTPIEGLSIQGGATYTDSTYGEFTAADLQVPSRFPALSLLPGNTVSFAPEFTSTMGITFDRSIGNGLRGGFSLSGKYTTEYNTGSDLIPVKMQDAFSLFNGRVSIGSEDERWTFEVWGQNLTDEEYYQVVFSGPLQGTSFSSTLQSNGSYYNPATDTTTYNAFLGQPRTFGATLRVKY